MVIRSLLVLVSCVASLYGEPTHHTRRYQTEFSTKKIRTVAFSPDSRELVVAIEGSTDFIDVATGEIMRTLKSFTTPFNIAYSRDGRRILLTSEVKRTMLDARTGSELPMKASRALPGRIGLAFEEKEGKILVGRIDVGGPADQTKLISVGDELVALGQGQNAKLDSVIGHSLSSFLDKMAGPAGSYLQLKILPKERVETSDTKVVDLRRAAFRVSNGVVEFDSRIYVQINENLARSHVDGRHEFRNAATGEVVGSIQTIDIKNIGQYAVSGDQKLFAVVARRKTGEGNGVEIFDIGRQNRIASVPLLSESFLSAAFDPSKNRLFVGTSKTIEVIDVTEQRPVGKFTLESRQKKRERDEQGNSLGGAAVTAVGDEVGELGISRAGATRKIAVSTTGLLATMKEFGEVLLWDAANGAFVKKLPSDKAKIRSPFSKSDDHAELRFSPDGKWLAYYAGGVLRIVDVSGCAASNEATKDGFEAYEHEFDSLDTLPLIP